jgi:hypothetical protein
MYKMDFFIEIFVPLQVFLIVRKVILVLVKIDATPIQRHILHPFLHIGFISIVQLILILLFKQSRKLGGVQKFVSENPSYKIVYD